MDKKLAKIIVKRMIDAAEVRTQEQLADVFGIRPQSISSSIADGRIPDAWFDIIEKRFKATREDLCRPPQKVSMSLEQNWGNAVQAEGCHTVNLNQGGTGQGITMQLTEREAMLIERLRIYGNQVLWSKIEADLDKLAQVSG